MTDHPTQNVVAKFLHLDLDNIWTPYLLSVMLPPFFGFYKCVTQFVIISDTCHPASCCLNSEKLFPISDDRYCNPERDLEPGISASVSTRIWSKATDATRPPQPVLRMFCKESKFSTFGPKESCSNRITERKSSASEFFALQEYYQG